MANEIVSTITLDFKEYQRQLEQAEKTGEKRGAKAGKRFGDGIEKAAGVGVKRLRGALLGLGTALGAAFTARAALQGAIAQEQAVTAIATALATTGELSRETITDFENLASSLQSVTGVGDELILQQAALAQGFTQNADLTKELTQAALDFSRGANISFEEATRRLGRSLSGSIDDVSKFDARIKTLTKDQLAAGDAIRLLGERFAGVAAAEAKNFGGALSIVQQNVGDFLESLGELITKSPLIVELLNRIGQNFARFANQIRKFIAEGGVQKFTLQFLNLARVITTNVGPVLEAFFNSLDLGFKTIKAGALNVLSFFRSDLKQAAEQATADLKQAAETGIFDFSGTAAAEGFINEMAVFTELAKPVVADAAEQLKNAGKPPIQDLTQFIKDGFTDAFRFVEEDENGVKRFTDRFEAEMKGRATNAVMAFRNGFVGAFSSIGQALAKGENGFAAFGKAILGLFGDLAIQLGQFYFLLGLGNLFLNPSAAAQQIAAGIGLQILGGFLKGLAGGGGGSSQASAGAGGAAASGGSLETAVDDVAATETEEERRPGTEVVVNVQGNVLDRRETGLELAEIINETFNTNDAVIAQAGG